MKVEALFLRATHTTYCHLDQLESLTTRPTPPKTGTNESQTSDTQTSIRRIPIFREVSPRCFITGINLQEPFMSPVSVSLSLYIPILKWAGMAQSVQRLATHWTVRGSNPGGGEIFRTRSDRHWGPPSLLYSG